MLAKKSIETGEGCDSIPESMRHYLAMQYDPTKPGTRDTFGRSVGYGAPGMYANESSPNGKVGTYSTYSGLQVANMLTCCSYFSFHLPFFDYWKLAPHRAERHGFGHILFA